jgi:hypothetical protein
MKTKAFSKKLFGIKRSVLMRNKCTAASVPRNRIKITYFKSDNVRAYVGLQVCICYGKSDLKPFRAKAQKKECLPKKN